MSDLIEQNRFISPGSSAKWKESCELSQDPCSNGLVLKSYSPSLSSQRIPNLRFTPEALSTFGDAQGSSLAFWTKPLDDSNSDGPHVTSIESLTRNCCLTELVIKQTKHGRLWKHSVCSAGAGHGMSADEMRSAFSLTWKDDKSFSKGQVEIWCESGKSV